MKCYQGRLQLFSWSSHREPGTATQTGGMGVGGEALSKAESMENCEKWKQNRNALW